MRLLHEIAIFQTVKSKVIISLFETVKLSVSISLRNLNNSLNSTQEKNLRLTLPLGSIGSVNKRESLKFPIWPVVVVTIGVSTGCSVGDLRLAGLTLLASVTGNTEAVSPRGLVFCTTGTASVDVCGIWIEVSRSPLAAKPLFWRICPILFVSRYLVVADTAGDC